MPVPGKAILKSSYPDDLIPFFHDSLGISPATLSTLVEGLCSLAAEEPTVIQVKSMITAINAMSPERIDLNPLMFCQILPVRRFGSNEISLQNRGSNFAIIDREKLAEIFKESAVFLDFSLEEVRQLDPFLKGLDLNQKYLSLACTEDTACTGDRAIDVNLTKTFQDRAYHLLRYV